MKLALIAVIISISLGSATLSQAAEIGKGPLTLSNKVNRVLNRYMDLSEPGALAVTTDGKYALYMFCSSAFCSGDAYVKQDAIDNCETKAQQKGINLPCRILAVDDEIVWDGPIKNLPKSLKEEEDPFAGWGSGSKEVGGVEAALNPAKPEDSIEQTEKQFTSIAIGSSASSPFSLGPIQIPLPKGNWIVIAKKAARDEMTDGDVLNLSIMLAQIEGDALKKIVSASTVGARTTEFKGVKKLKACERDGFLFRETRANGGKFQDCWFVNHSALIKKEESPVWGRAFSFLRTRGLTIPTETPYVGFRMANGEHWVTARYYWNAESDGFEAKEYEGRSNSEWYADNIGYFPKKQSYVEKLKAWGAILRHSLKDGLEGKP